MKPRNFTIIKALGQTGRRAEFLGKMTDDGSLVTIYRYLGATSAAVPEWQQILFDAERIANFSAPGLQAFPFCGEDPSGLVLLKKHLSLPSLEEFLQGAKSAVELPAFFTIADSLLQALDYCHRHQVLHKALYPANIFINPDTLACTLGYFSVFELLNQGLCGEKPRTDALAYSSPELTTRMIRKVEAPSDFYSLGCIFYRLLQGAPPFAGSTPHELIYAHLAKEAPSLALAKPSLPQALVQLVEKMLRKEPADRYRSASGLIADLQAVKERVLQGTAAGELTLGLVDRHHVFFIPDKLYGREAEINAAITHFDAMDQQRMNVLCVGGYSGIGKTRLIQELLRPLTARAGYYSAGKYEQFAKAKPFFGLIQAISMFCRQKLSQESSEIDRFKINFQQLIGNEGRCLTDLIPTLSLLVGEQPALQELSPEVNELRVHRCMENFLSLMTEKNAPLILFLDDMQWADRVSIKFLIYLLQRHRLHNLYLVCAFRSNEVDETCPFFLMREELSSNSSLSWLDLEVPPLDLESVGCLVAETLIDTPQRVESLTAAVYQKTQGNPFFVRQLLESLYGAKIIHQGAQGWEWELDKIASTQFADDVVSFMIGKISRYSQETQDYCNWAALIGLSFSLKLLQKITAADQTLIYQRLHPLIVDNLLLEHAGVYTFAHDRVLEACYRILPGKKREQRHLRLGNVLDKELSTSPHEDLIFAVVDHLNHAEKFLATRAERRHLAHLNFQAGTKALAASAYNAAYGFLHTALGLWDEEAEEKNAENLKFSYELHAAHAQAAHCEAHYDYAEASIKQCFALETDLLRNERSITLYIELLFLVNRHQEGITFALSHLKNLGLSLPARAHKGHVVWQYLKFLGVGGWRNPLRWAAHKPCTDRHIAAAMNIANIVLPSCYMVNSDMLAVLCITMAYLAIKHGINKDAAAGFAVVGAIEIGSFKFIKRGRVLQQVAEKINAKYPDVRINAQLHFLFALFGAQWDTPFAKLYPAYKQAAALNQECGVMHWADYALAFSSVHRVFCQQKPLWEIEQECMACLKFHEPHKDRETILNQKFILDYLREMSANFSTRPEPLLDHEAYAREMARPGNLMPRAHFDIFGQISFLLQEKHRENVRAGLAFFMRSLDLIGILLEYFHRLSFAVAWLNVDKKTLTRGEKLAGGVYFWLNLFYLRLWSRNCKENHRGYYLLVLAERAAHKKNYKKAEKYYRQAVASAPQTNWFAQAYIWQRFAAFEDSRGQAEIAEIYCREAFRLYRFYGFLAQGDFLLQRYPHFALIRDPEGRDAGLAVKIEKVSALEGVDKIVLTIANKSTMDELIAYTIAAILEGTGAQRAVLLSISPGKSPLIIAQARHGSSGIERDTFPPQGAPLNSATCALCMPLLMYVMRMREPYCIDDAERDIQFSGDPYFIKKISPARSLFCFPVINNGVLCNVIYLENNLATGIFSATQATLLTLISSQLVETLQRIRANEQKHELELQMGAAIKERLEKELQQVQGSLIAQSRLAALGDMAGGIAHEFNTPLATILMGLRQAERLLSEDSFDKKSLLSVFSRVDAAGNKIGKIIEQLRYFSRNGEQDAFNLHQVRDIVSDTILLCQEKFNSAHIELRLGELPTDLAIECRQVQISQVIMNLLQNAYFEVKDLEPTRRWVLLATTQLADKIQLSVEDGGAGFSPEMKEKFLLPFVTSKAPGEGAGLGLSVAAEIAKDHHARIFLDETSAHTRVVVELPHRQ